jgi:hypothetical protein
VFPISNFRGGDNDNRMKAMYPIVPKLITVPAVLPDPVVSSVGKQQGAGFAEARMRVASGEANAYHRTLAVPNAATVPNSKPAPAAILQNEAVNTGVSLKNLDQRVSALPKTSSFGPLRDRLERLEKQFNQAGAAIGKSGPQSDPKRLLGLQHEIYQINEEVELLAKMIEQATGGVKSILQTQV